MPQYDDDLLLGTAIAGGPNDAASVGVAAGGLRAANAAGGSSLMTKGIGPLGRIYVYDQVPLTKQAASIAALQTLAGAGNLVLTAGTGVTVVIDAAGVTRYTFDVPRCVSLASTGNISGVNFTISGYDVYGQPMTQLLAGPNNNTVTTLKAFFSIVSIAASAAVATNTSAGSSDIFGLPVIVPDAGYIARAGWAETLAADAGTFVAADATTPATTATGDVRGTYAPSSASNGVRRLVLGVLLSGSIVGPKATRVGALGVTQV